MKKTDYAGIGFVILFTLLVVFFPFNVVNTLSTPLGEFQWTGFSEKGIQSFGRVTSAYPYLMGFLKFMILATFGEMLKNRMKSGKWMLDILPVRALVWGFFGMVMTFAFALFAKGMGAILHTGIWPFPKNDFSFALSTSFAMNMIFAYPMMLAHEWCNAVLAARKWVGGEAFFGALNAHAWGSFIPKTIVWFWIPAHTVTFLLPPSYRVLMGAALGVALGFILALAAGKRHAK